MYPEPKSLNELDVPFLTLQIGKKYVSLVQNDIPIKIGKT